MQNPHRNEFPLFRRVLPKHCVRRENSPRLEDEKYLFYARYGSNESIDFYIDDTTMENARQDAEIRVLKHKNEKRGISMDVKEGRYNGTEEKKWYRFEDEVIQELDPSVQTPAPEKSHLNIKGRRLRRFHVFEIKSEGLNENCDVFPSSKDSPLYLVRPRMSFSTRVDVARNGVINSCPFDPVPTSHFHGTVVAAPEIGDLRSQMSRVPKQIDRWSTMFDSLTNGTTQDTFRTLIDILKDIIDCDPYMKNIDIAYSLWVDIAYFDNVQDWLLWTDDGWSMCRSLLQDVQETTPHMRLLEMIMCVLNEIEDEDKWTVWRTCALASSSE
mmetsp:Transcript_39992/g.103264  ORF Transcript_39992/g.103264 Transcript_39992/m.103264 type:complete len:327 (+) Transcript_39992:951-1931(+)